MGKCKQPARFVDVACYSAETLAEDGDRTTDWEIISINASPVDHPVPMRPLTMARNERHLAGGTSGAYSKDEYIDAILFWSKHAMAEPADLPAQKPRSHKGRCLREWGVDKRVHHSR